ncbi:hypothetical protein BT96DRAFT_927667 [Gymnopus androsaceus JB14]|uniref:AA1-like domain-containing protein n=1 Tax=Gymnopus androsaceus JB14 TaxID=1447944 RepID=A0A6A4GPT2_9AGAR|nr:hypothetical protein BT96DRAFT_927667 [Gymnopus androsaceus JB14]
MRFNSHFVTIAQLVLSLFFTLMTAWARPLSVSKSIDHATRGLELPHFDSKIEEDHIPEIWFQFIATEGAHRCTSDQRSEVWHKLEYIFIHLPAAKTEFQFSNTPQNAIPQALLHCRYQDDGSIKFSFWGEKVGGRCESPAKCEGVINLRDEKKTKLAGWTLPVL